MNKDWDDPVTEDENDTGSLPRELPKGEYRFAVKKMTKAMSDGDKTKGAPLAKLEFVLFGKDDAGYEKPIGIGYDNLIRHTSTDWKVAQFFVAISERKHGQTITPDWSMVPQAQGRAVFIPSTHDNKTTMKVEKYLDPVEKSEKPDFG